MARVTGKFLGMRKAQDFTVYPRKATDTTIMVQSDRAIGRFDIETGKGVLNWRGSQAKYTMHLSPSTGAEEFTFPIEFIMACLEAAPVPGQEIGPGVSIAPERCPECKGFGNTLTNVRKDRECQCKGEGVISVTE